MKPLQLLGNEIQFVPFDSDVPTLLAQIKQTVIQMEHVKWHSIPEAIEALQVSRTTLYRKMDSGELESKKEKGNRLVGIRIVTNGTDDDTANVNHVPADDTTGTPSKTNNGTNGTNHETNGTLDETVVLQSEVIEQLKEQVSYLKEQVKHLQAEQVRSQTIIMSMSQNQQLLLQNSRQSWWQKIFGLGKQSEGATTG